MTEMSPLWVFCRTIRTRSKDNQKAVQALYTDITYRDELIAASVEGRTWTRKGGKGRVTDREMVEISDKLHGWDKSVYNFGCAFIHLSNFHDYQERDPLEMISANEISAELRL